MRIHILFPVLNEENRLRQGVLETVSFMENNFKDAYKITIVDNGSEDKTESIARNLVNDYKTVNYVRLNERGVGLALRKGIEINDCDIVGYMDIDLSTHLDHLLEMYKSFTDDKSIEIFNGSRNSKNSKVIGRKISREITSRGLNILLKIVLGMKIDDSLCGFKFFRKKTIENLVKISSDNKGWFFCAELMLRAERQGIKIKEIPVVWRDDYDTHANVPKLIKAYLKEIFNLFIEFRIKS